MLSVLSLFALTSVAEAADFEIYYQVNLTSSGTYSYDFRMIQQVSGSGYGLGWMIVGDWAGTSGTGTCGKGSELVGATLTSAAPYPWTSLSSSSGGHNGPTFSYVLDKWAPAGQGDWIEWQFEATNKIDYTDSFFWSTIYGNSYSCIQLLEGDPDGDGLWDDFCSYATYGDDTDGDGVIDVCENPCEVGDADKDGVCDDVDVCLGYDDTADDDGDLVPDGCDICEGEDESGDVDGDGVCALWDKLTWDCDDTNPDTYPGATEVCDGDDNNCDGRIGAEEADGDADGVLVCGLDCDDTNASIYPGATELCDGIDNDCDGAPGADEVDEDADGLFICENDCDDSDPDTFDGALELCDGFDNDCDGLLSDEEADVDGDGLGSCFGDCDDSDASASPDLPEACGDGIDNNCDGTVDEDCASDGGDGTDGTDDGGGKTGCSALGVTSGGLWALALSGLALFRRRQRA